MANLDHLQSSFAGGEISHRLHGRVDTDLYRRALARCSDFEVTPQGSLLSRGGSVFSAALPSGAVRLIPIRMADEQDYVLVLSDGALQVFDVGGGVLIANPGAVQQLIVNGTFASGLTGWGTVGTVTVSGGAAHIGATAAHLYQSFTLASDQDVIITVQVVQFGNPSWMGWPFIVFGHGTANPSTGVPVGAQLINETWTPGSVPVTKRYTLHLTAGDYTLCLGGASDGTNDIIFDNVSVTYDAGGGTSGYSISAPWHTAHLPGIRYAAQSAGNVVYLVHPDLSLPDNSAGAIYYVQKSDTGWSLQPLTLTSKPTEWTRGNFPSVVAWYQSRLWLAAAPQQRNTIWASKVGTASDFTQPGTPTAKDSLVIPIATQGVVHWMVGRNMLLAGTDLNEHAITAAGGPVTPSDMQVRDESGFGSAAIQACDLGNQVLYVSRDRRKVRSVGFELNAQQWISRDVTFVAEHLTEALISEVHFARDPHSTIVCVLDDGTLACCTYDHAEQVVAWWTADVGGTVLSAAVSNGPDGSIVHLAVQRGSSVGLEYIPMSEFHPSRVYMDCARIADVTGAPLTDGVGHIGGLTHLEGQTVALVLDGAYQGTTTVTSGTVYFQGPGDVLVVGLPYTPEAETLPPVKGSVRAKRRWVKLWMRLHNSALPLVAGNTDGKAIRVAPDRSASTPMDTAEPLFTGDVGQRGLPTDWEERGQVIIRQDLPLRTEILGIFGTLAEQEV